MSALYWAFMAKGNSGNDEAKHAISVERAIDAPARVAYRCWVEKTVLHPDQILKRTTNRLVKFTWTGKDAPESVASIEFESRGSESCVVRVTHSEIVDEVVARVLEQKWADELDAAVEAACLAEWPDGADWTNPAVLARVAAIDAEQYIIVGEAVRARQARHRAARRSGMGVGA